MYRSIFDDLNILNNIQEINPLDSMNLDLLNFGQKTSQARLLVVNVSQQAEQVMFPSLKSQQQQQCARVINGRIFVFADNCRNVDSIGRAPMRRRRRQSFPMVVSSVPDRPCTDQHRSLPPNYSFTCWPWANEILTTESGGAD